MLLACGKRGVPKQIFPAANLDPGLRRTTGRSARRIIGDEKLDRRERRDRAKDRLTPQPERVPKAVREFLFKSAVTIGKSLFGKINASKRQLFY
jgi:hypothetical protein